MAKTTHPKTVMLVDDEQHNVLWLKDYLEGCDFEVLTAESVNEAVEKIGRNIYRALIIDLNIPILEPLISRLQGLGKEYAAYPGLYLAYYARNIGYRDRQAILYSVHRDANVAVFAGQLGLTYIMKGRPHEIKREIDLVVAFDPTAS